MVTIDVVIPHYGDSAVTLHLVHQLRDQVAGEGGRLIVVDDASPIPFPDPDGVEVVRRVVNGGFGSAVNSGAARVAATHMLVLNSDLETPDDFIASMKVAACRRPRAVLSPRVTDDRGNLAWAGRAFPRISHQAVEWLTPLARWRDSSLWHRSVGHDLRQLDGESEVDWVMGAAMLIPVVDFRAVGGFDERFFMNAEEVDLQRRLKERGIHSVVLHTPIVVHAGGGSTPPERRRSWLVQSRVRYAEKWGGSRRLRATLVLCSLANFAVNCLRRAAGRPVPPLRTLRSELTLVFGR